MTRQNYWFLEKGERNIIHENQLKLCEIFRCSLNDLFDENVEYKNIENTNSFNFVSNIINSQYDDFLKIKKFKIINIDSFILDNTNDIIGTNMIYNYMFPTIGNNDIILINKNNKNIYHNRLYLINENGILKARRIQQPDPTINNYVVLADNKNDPDFIHYNTTYENIKENIIGNIFLIFKKI